MTPELEFTLHLLTAAVGAYVIVLFLRRLVKAIDKGLGGKLSTTQPWKSIGAALSTMLPLLPCIPAGLIFMAWPADAILPEPGYQFLAGAISGSISANLYEMATRFIEKKAGERLGSPPES